MHQGFRIIIFLINCIDLLISYTKVRSSLKLITLKLTKWALEFFNVDELKVINIVYYFL